MERLGARIRRRFRPQDVSARGRRTLGSGWPDDAPGVGSGADRKRYCDLAEEPRMA